MLIQTYEGKTILEWALLAKEQRQRIAQLEEQRKVAEQIEGSFWAALKLLNLTELDVQNPGRHFTERIAQLEAEVARLNEQITYLQAISTEQVERIRALEPKDWTEEKPTVPGWYWFKEMSKNGVVMGVSVLQLKWEEPYGKDREYGGYFYDAETDLTLDELRGQWSGPIEEPKGESS